MMGDTVAFNTKYHRAQLKHVHRLRWILNAAPDPLIAAQVRTGKRKPRPAPGRLPKPAVKPQDRLGSAS